MDRFFKFIGFITCIAVILYGASWLIQHFPKYVKPTLQGLGVVALLALFVRLYLGRDWLMKLGKEFVIGSDLIKASENFLNDLPKPKNETTANFIGHLVYRFTRLGIIGLMLALIPITLLYQQNRLLSKQNEKIDKQNQRLDQQTYLQEAERRSSLVFLFSNIMDAIDRELKEDYNDDSIRNLSPELIGRIVALSGRLQPYRYLEGDDLIKKPLSPERGQLLVSLHGSKLDSLTMIDICEGANFNYADLAGANLSDADLRGADLRGANISDGNISATDLVDANLTGVNLSDADLRGVNLRGANISDANIRDVILRDVILVGANLSDTDLRGANISDVYLDNADLRGADLRDVNLRNVNLGGANIRDADLRGVNLRGVNLRGAIVEGNFIQNIQRHEKKNTIMGEFFLEYYQIDSTQEYGEWIYFLKSKNK